MKRMSFKKEISIFMLMMLLLNLIIPIGSFKVNADSTLVGVSIGNPSSIVLGKTKTVSVTLSNNHSAYLYNVGLEIELEPGMEFVVDSENTDLAPEVTTEESTYSIDLGDGPESVTMNKQKLVWKDIKDLAYNDGKNENFTVSFQVKSLKAKQCKDEHGVTHNLDIDFGDGLVGRARAAASTDRQLLPTDWTSYKEFQILVEPFEVILSGGGEHLKGAGEYGNLEDANRPYVYTIQVINNEFYDTKIALINGIVSEIEVQNFSRVPNYSVFMNDNDYYEVFWDDIALKEGETITINYDAAVFNRYTTTGGAFNDGDIIQDNTSLDNDLIYSGYITDFLYQGDEDKEYTNSSQPIKNPTIAKDIIISKGVAGVSGSNTSRFKYNDEFKYNITTSVNGYYDVENIVVTDIIGDGQTYITNSATTVAVAGYGDVTPDVSEENPDGTRVITWEIPTIEFDGDWSKDMSLNVTVDPTYYDGTPIVANDSLGNSVDVIGQGMPIYRVPDDDHYKPIRQGTDASGASIRAGIPSISKVIKSKLGSLGPDNELQVGDLITFTITYTANLGVKQKAVIISDILPLGLKFIDINPIINKTGGWETYSYDETINANRNIVTWTFNDMLSEDVVTLTVDVTAEVQDIPEVTIDKQDQNLAKLTFKNTPNVVDSDRDGVLLTYLGCVLDLSKTANPTQSLKDGDEITFTITVDNTAGDAPAFDVVVEDTVPSEFQNIDITPDGTIDSSQSSGNNLKFIISKVDAGTTKTIEYKATVKAGIGSKYSMTNSAELKSYKKKSGGVVYTDQTDSDSVTMTTDPVTIEKTIQEQEHNPQRVGDWVVYKIKVDVPTKTTAYNSQIVDMLPTNHSIVGVYSDYIDHSTKTSLVLDLDYTVSGRNITIPTGNLYGGEYDYYIETIVTEVPSTTNTATFDYDDMDSGGNSYSISDTANLTVNIPNLTSSWDKSNNAMYKGKTDAYTYTIENTGSNTAYDFTPVIKIPQEFSATNFVANGTNIGAIVPTNETIGSEIHNVYTLPKIDELAVSGQYPINMDITQDNNRGSADDINLYGYTGNYYTHDNDGNVDRKEHSSVSATTLVNIPKATITKSVNRTEYSNSTTEIRPGDTIWYDLVVTIHQGTSVYDLKLVDTLPTGFVLTSITNNTLGGSIVGPDYLISDSIVNDTGSDISYNITVEAVANENHGFLNPLTGWQNNVAKIKWNTKETNGTEIESDQATAGIKVMQPLLVNVGYGQTGPIEFADINDVEAFTLIIRNDGGSAAYDSEFRIEIPDFLESADDTPDYTVEEVGGKTYLKWLDKEVAVGATITLPFNLRLISDGTVEVGKEGTLNAEIVGYTSLPVEGKSYICGVTKQIDVEVADPTLDLYVLDKSTNECEKEVFTEDDDVTLRTKITLPEGTKLYDGKISIDLSNFIEASTLTIKDGVNGENKTIVPNGGSSILKFDIPSDYTTTAGSEIITDIVGKTVASSPGYSVGAPLNTATLKWISETKSLEDTAQVGLIAFSVTKNATPLNAVLGEEITYTIRVENRGSETLTNINVIDNLPPYIDINTTIPSLAPGVIEELTASYGEVVESDLQGSDNRTITNIVNIDTNYSGTILTDSDSMDVNLLKEHAIQVVKEADILAPLVGDLVTYTITVTNISTSKNLTNVTVKDTMLNINQNIGDLAIGESKLVTGNYVVKITDPKEIVNTVQVEGDDNGNKIREDGQKTIYVNTPPEVGNYSETTDEDTPVGGTVVGTDVDDDILTYSKDSDPSHGSVVVNSDGTWTYTPATNYVGTDSFTVKVSDGKRGEAISTVDITINPTNDAPDATDYTDTTPEETPVSGTVVGTDIEGDGITYSKGSNPSNGTVEVDNGGNWTYTPDKDFVGDDSFTVSLDDGNGGVSVSTVTITVTPENDPPTVPDYSKETWMNTPTSDDIVGNDIDGDVLSYSLNADGTHGTAEVENEGSWTYTPESGYLGDDSFTVLVDDGNGETVISTVTITIRRRPNIITNNSPEVPNYSVETPKNTKVKGVVVGTDPDGDALSYLRASTSVNGTAVVGKDGSWTYTPDTDFVGTDSFQVSVTDGKGGTAVSVITINVLDDDITAYEINLSANPQKILGDGKSTSILTAKVTDNFGDSVVGANVVFTAPYGSFPEGANATTDTQGIASVVYQSEKIKGTEPVISKITASVRDEERDLYAEDSINITFEPAAIRGVVVDNETGLPIEGAVVVVSKDFDGDGEVDFVTEYITKVDGRYIVYVPEGHVVYEVSITKPIVVGDDVVDMTFTQKGQVDEITGVGGEVFESRKTATGVLMIKQPDGNESLLPDYSEYEVDVYDDEGNLVDNVDASISQQTGIFHVENLERNKEYKLALKREVAPGVHIIVGKVAVTLNDDGEINISEALIDPYGTITDSVTGEIIEKADVKLYYADTKRNIDSGREPHDHVDLPIIDFPPNDNHNPQDSDEFGKYAYMVFPHTDYYIVVDKLGYHQYVSPIISVELEIVKHDIEMDPIEKPEEDKIPIPKTGDRTMQLPYTLLLILISIVYMHLAKRKILQDGF